MKKGNTRTGNAATRRRRKLTERQFAAALARGRNAWRKLTASEGGSISSVAAAELIGISESAVLRKYRMGQLLGWKDEGTDAIWFPRWQFAKGKVLPGLAKVMSVLNQAGYLDDKARILFFLSEFSFVACRPLDLLREGRLNEALLASKHYIE